MRRILIALAVLMTVAGGSVILSTLSAHQAAAGCSVQPC
jgi:hypothetical protein